MAKRFFEHFNLRPASLALIERINEVIETYRRMGYVLTVRQLYYQLVAANAIPNNEKMYDNIVALVTKGRLMGLIDWDMIQDRTRSVERQSSWSRPHAILEAVAEQFRIDRWSDQPYHIVVLIEKQALADVIYPVCEELGVSFMANKGYASASALYYLGRSLRELRRAKKTIKVLYFGDHDPSGIDMTRDVLERLELFSEGEILVDRVALNMQQVEEYGPPENPAKVTDSRFAAYVERYGESSWELDALAPPVLDRLVRDTVARYRDDTLYRAKQRQEGRMRRELAKIVAGVGQRTAAVYQDGIGYKETFVKRPYEGHEDEEWGGIYAGDDEVVEDLEPLDEWEQENPIEPANGTDK